MSPLNQGTLNRSVSFNGLDPNGPEEGRVRNSDGRWDMFRRLFRTRLVTGRLWDDHLRIFSVPTKVLQVSGCRF